MAEFHFVADYERLVQDLIAAHPMDQAMAPAVGGAYEALGEIECDLLRHAGLRDGMSLIDLGCGSGRLSSALGRRMRIDYLGTDIVQALLDYAASKAPANYRFMCHREVSLPAPDASADMICGFSVFTHLLHEESYLYLEDASRVLRPGGKIVFSFLEFAEPGHWAIFLATVGSYRLHKRPYPVLNTFIERSAIETWAAALGCRVEGYLGATEAPWGGPPLGQATAILRRT